MAKQLVANPIAGPPVSVQQTYNTVALRGSAKQVAV
jgi:hypothetical protein